MLSKQMDASNRQRTKAGVTDVDALASDRDDAGVPVHRGWAPLGARHRWMEPFVLVLLAGGSAHGYAITAQLEEMGITGGPVDIGQVYRTLRDLEHAGQVTSILVGRTGRPATTRLRAHGRRLRGDRRLGGRHEGASEAHRRVQRSVPRSRRGAAKALLIESRSLQRLGSPRGRCPVRGGAFSSTERFRSRTPRYSSSSARWTFSIA